MAGPSRREVLRAAGVAAVVLGCRGARGVGGGARIDRADGDGRLVTRLDDPYCAEAPLAELVRGWITPVELFYVLEHGRPPRRGPEAVEVVGMVRRPRVIGIDEVRRGRETVTATLVCAGNRRREHHARRPVDDPLLWGAGAIGNARWTGARLRDVLEECGVGEGARHVWFEGGDEVPGGGGFGGSIELARVWDRRAPPVLLAHAMNGAPLTRSHGAPVRTIVPGHIGARSIKWLRRIVVSDRPSPNASFVRAHRLGDEPIYDLPINSAICDVRRHGGGARVTGYAIAGAPTATIARVEVRVDGGPWRAAHLHGDAVPSCWRLWSAEVPAGARLVARAIDSRGAEQPQHTPWNPDGYLYNGWPTVPLRTGSGSPRR